MKYLQLTPRPQWLRVAAAALALAIVLAALPGRTPVAHAGAYAAGTGTVFAWGSNSAGQVTVPPGLGDVNASPPLPPACATTWRSRRMGLWPPGAITASARLTSPQG